MMDHFDGGAIDDQGSAAAIWEWQSQDYYCGLQKDGFLLPDPSSSLWDLQYQFCDIVDSRTSLWTEASNNINVGDDWSMLDVQTPPVKQCADFEYHFCDIGAGKNIVTRKEPRTYVIHPFEFIEPYGEVTLDDINDMNKAKPPHKMKHKNGEESNSAIISGKPVVHKRRILALPPHDINDEEPNSFQASSSAISGKLPVVAHKRRRIVHITKGKQGGNGTIITINCACFLCCGKAK